jgi:hypothetical protein
MRKAAHQALLLTQYLPLRKSKHCARDMRLVTAGAVPKWAPISTNELSVYLQFYRFSIAYENDSGGMQYTKTGVFSDVTPCGCYKNRGFGGTDRIYHQADKNR